MTIGRAALCVSIAGITARGGEHNIDHVVVLMLENRAFDHMLGFMKRGGDFGDMRVDGLTGSECNLKNLSDPTAGKVCVTDEALDHCPYDPSHSFASTTERVFGCHWKKTPDTPCVDIASTNGTADMSGFTDSSRRLGKDGVNEMTMWPPEKVPIITTLAKEFALFDRYFASHPGSTYPNRQFVLSATAHGMTDTGGEVPKGGFPQKTVLRSFEESNMTWKMYYEGSLAWAIFMADVQRAESKPNLLNMSAFYEDAASGALPNFSFLEPRIHPDPAAAHLPSYGLANHQHPTASIREGERWMKDVYEAVRNGPQWNNTLLIITYDEHGGFYDHVPPPQVGVPIPDGICTKEGFEYTRLGIRVPTIVVSPWIKKGTLVHDPPAAQKPSEHSAYEHSSVPATLRKLFPQLGGPLNVRDAWAPTFEHLLMGGDLRTDCPVELPTVLPPPSDELSRQLQRPIDEHAEGLMHTMCELLEEGEGCGAGVETYEQYAPWITQRWKAWMNGPGKKHENIVV